MGFLIPTINASAAAATEAAAEASALAAAESAVTIASKFLQPLAVAYGILSLEDSNLGIPPITSGNDEERALESASALLQPPKAINIGDNANTEPSVNITSSINIGAQPQKLSVDVPIIPPSANVSYAPASVPPPTTHHHDNPVRRLPTTVVNPVVPYTPVAPTGGIAGSSSVHTVDETSTDKKYGGLLHSPVTNNSYPAADYSNAIKKYYDDLKTHQQAAGAEFAKWANGFTSNSDIALIDTGLTFESLPTGNTTTNTGRGIAAPFPTANSEVVFPSFGLGGTADSDLSHQRSRGAFCPPVSSPTTNLQAFKLPLNLNIPLPGLPIPISPPGIAGGVIAPVLPFNPAKTFNPGNLLPNLGNNVKKGLGILDFSKLLMVINLAVELHNAALLSTQVVQSCLDIIQNILTAMGLKDWEGNPIEITHLIGDSIENIIQGAVGANNYATFKEKWKRYSVVYNAAANILNSMTTIAYGTLQVIQITGQYVASIGNALHKAGVVFEDAYAWMNEGLSARIARFESIHNALNNSAQFANDLDTVSQVGLQSKQTVDEIGDQVKEFNKAAKEAFEKEDKKDKKDKKDSTPVSTLPKGESAPID